jgi:mannose-6-phosphate isomerase
LDPIRLAPNQIRRTYRGGDGIAALRGEGGGETAGPEDWVGSTTTVFDEDELGLSRLPDGRFLRDAIAADPEAYLGREHSQALGSDPGLLVKLLDAGQRLPVHCHPDRDFARRHLRSRWGKTEAWLVISTRTQPAVVWVGFRQQIAPEVILNWTDRQDSSAMLQALNEVRVSPGDVVFVPAGVPHAIGDGMLICELQEPSDFGFLFEWRGYVDSPDTATMALGWQRAVEALDRSPWNDEKLARLGIGKPREERRPGVVELVGGDHAQFFRAERIRPDSRRADALPSFAILVIVGGSGEMRSRAGTFSLHRGETWLVPHGLGPTTFSGDGLDLLRCLPPEVG